MKSQVELLQELDDAYTQVKENIMSEGEYSYDDYATQGGRMVSKLSVDNCHDLMDLTKELTLIGHTQFKAGLCFNEVNGKFRITMSGQKIMLEPDAKGKISFNLSGMYVTGIHKLILLKEIMIHSELISTKTSNGWDMYTIDYNNFIYTVGFMTTEMGTVSFMKDYKKYEYTPEGKEYYKMYRKQRANDLWITRKWELTQQEDMYGWKGANNMAEFQEDQLMYVLDMALDAGRISESIYTEITTGRVIDFKEDDITEP